MPDDSSLYRMCGEVYTYDELKAASEAELAELNDLQGSNFTFDDYLIESVHTGTIETVDDDEAGRNRQRKVSGPQSLPAPLGRTGHDPA